MGKGRRARAPPPPGDPPNPSSTARAVGLVGLGILAAWFPTIATVSSEYMPSLAALWSTAWAVMAAVLALLILIGLAAAGIATFVVVKRAWSPLPGSAATRGVVVANCDVSPSSPFLRVSTAAHVVDAPSSCCAEAPAPAGTQGSTSSTPEPETGPPPARSKKTRKHCQCGAKYRPIVFDTETISTNDDVPRFYFHLCLRRLLHQGRISPQQFVTAAIIDDRCQNAGCGKRLAPAADHDNGRCVCAQPMGNLAEWAKYSASLNVMTELTVDALQGDELLADDKNETPENADTRFLEFVSENPHTCVRCRRSLKCEESDEEPTYGSGAEMLFGRNACLGETGDEEMDFKLAMMRQYYE